MAEELQHLIDRIQREAISTGEKQAAAIVSQAREKAAALVREAEEKAAAFKSKAEEDARQYTERSQETLAQAARDVLITVGQGVENILANLAREAVDEALTIEVLQQMIVKMSEAYAARSGRERRMELLLNPEEQAKVVEFFRERYQKKLRVGLELRPDRHVFKGFKVSLVDDHVYHDFTRGAIAEALAAFLRPHLADIVYRVAREGQDASHDDRS